MKHLHVDSLPRLRQDVDALLTKCTKDIDDLPPPLGNDPQIEVLGRANAFCDVFKSFVNGSHEDKHLAQGNRALRGAYAAPLLTLGISMHWKITFHWMILKGI